MRGRMPQRFRAWSKTAVMLVGLMIAGSLLIPQPAHADPHALFYTAVGQRQLFFNVLAALDQADYVETADQRGELAERRDTAREEDAGSEGVTQVTETNLSTVLTRAVTIEGQDLFTTYQELQLATEAKRRKDFDRTIRILCSIAYGREDCGHAEEEDETGKEIEPAQDPGSAYIDDVQEFVTAPQRGGSAILASNTNPRSYDQQERRQLQDEEKNGRYIVPRPYDTHLANLQDSIEATANQESPEAQSVFQSALDNLKTKVAGNSTQTVSPDVYDNLTVTADGEIDIKADPGANDELSQLTETLAGLVALPQQVSNTYQRGKAQVAAVQDQRFGNHLPDTDAVPKADKQNAVDCTTDACQTNPIGPDSEPLKTIKTNVRVPASSKHAAASVGLSETAGNAAGQITTNPAAESEPGTVPAASGRGAAAGPGVAGTRDEPDAAANQGMVAGTETLSRPPADDEKLDADDLLINPIEEQGALHFLEFSGLRASKKSTKCGCSLEGALDDHGGAVAGAIRGRR